MALKSKLLPKTVRNRMSVMIAAALGFFLATQYNNVIGGIINTWLPVGEETTARIVYIIVLTVFVVYVTAFLDKVLKPGGLV